MVSKEDSTKVVRVFIKSLFLLILLVWGDVASSAWQPPIGIPSPDFGINETYRMYDNPNNRNPNLTYHQNAEGGFYTHYIDNTHPNATDTNNPYGTVQKPRLTIPYNGLDSKHHYLVPLQPGEIIEVHGIHNLETIRPDGWLDGYLFTGGGTKAQPAFVRGGNPNNPAVITTIEKDGYGNGLSGSYIILENFKFDNSALGINGSNSAVRNCEVFNIERVYGRAVTISNVSDVVFYNNHIHHNWGTWPDGSKDMHNTAVTGDSNRIWVVDNYLHHASYMPDGTAAKTGGDAIQVMGPAHEPWRLTHVYIGRNHMHTDTENAVDIKASEHVVISENIAHDYLGDAVMINHEDASNTWFIFNKIYDARVGIRPEETTGDTYVINNVIHDIDYPLGGKTGVFDVFVGGIYVRTGYPTHIIGNTLFNVTGGILIPVGNTNNIILNNIISYLPKPWYHIGSDQGQTITSSEIDYNLFHQPTGVQSYTPDGVARFKSGSVIYGLANFQAAYRTKNINSIEADPLFVDAANNDFHLQAGSPAIDSGTNGQQVQNIMQTYFNTFGVSIDVDIEGNPRPQGFAWDIGAYEGFSSDPNNPSPVLQGIGDKSVDENVILTFTINATDPNGEPITYSASGLPSGASLDSQTGDFTWTPSYTQAGIYSVTFRASDGNSYVSETIIITVNNINRAPVLGAINDKSVDENALLSFFVIATDPDGQQLIYSISGLPSGAVFANQTFIWTPSYSQAGTFAVTFTVDDGQAQDSEVITITVINVNRAPVLAAINNQSVWSDDPLSFTVSATDPDGDSVTYSANAVPSGATFITQTFNWTPTPAQIGTYNITFYASDGQLQDSEAITITVNVDTLAPNVTNLLPASGAIQVPLNNLITFHVTDGGKGINPASVKIKLRINNSANNDTIYFGDLGHDTSLLGDCRRIGTNVDYQYVFQPRQDLFYYDQTITVTVEVSDFAGNIMNPYIYSFVTEMFLFGQNKQVNATSDNNYRPVTVCDSSGNIWAAWHTGSSGSRDIYVGKQAAGDNNFGSAVQLTRDITDQCNPALALDSSDKLYAVWQDNREGDWDIYILTSIDGINWSSEIRVNDPNNGNQINPAIVIDSRTPNYVHVVWQDDRAGNQDICIASSNDGFITKTTSQITSNTADQIEPAIAVDSSNTIYVVWTDNRNASSDIYGAASNSGPWTNVSIVNNTKNQSNPAIVTESTGTMLHLLWVDDTPGNNDIYYASSNGLPSGSLTGSSIIDDTSGADQSEPTVAVTGATSTSDLKVFACWLDSRNTDTDLYFTELSTGSGTNVFVNDGGSNAYQSEPALGVDADGNPYLIWSDNRSINTNIYYAGSTSLTPVALASATVSASAPGTTIVGVDPQTITNVDDVSIAIPSGSCSYDVDISIVEISNQQTFAAPCFGGYEFSPSGIQFNQPVTITIPYVYSASYGSTVPYWFNSLTGTLSQQGITNVRDIEISPTLHAVSFETTHFTSFYLLGDGGVSAVLGGGGGGGGGCSVSDGNKGNFVEFTFPYILLAGVMAVIKIRDVRHHKLHII